LSRRGGDRREIICSCRGSPKFRGLGSRGPVCGHQSACKLSLTHRASLNPFAIGTLAVQVNQDIPGLGALARAHDAPLLQHIHDARGAAVADF